MLFSTIFNLILLVFLWRDGDAGSTTKIVLTAISFAIWALILWTPGAVIVAQCLLILIIGSTVFGVDWMNQRVR